VIVNLPAQVYLLVTNWIEKNNLIELGKQSKISCCKWFVCTGGYDSVQLFLKSVQHFEKRIAHVLVRNCGLEDDWSSVEEMEEVQNAVKKYEVKVIDFSKFYSRKRNAIDARRITLVRQTELTKVATSARSLVVAAGILLTTLGVGAFMGWMGLLWWQGGFASGEAVHLTQEQAEALRWATSAEGKFARNLMRWNSDSLTNLECKKDVKRLGVTLEVAGRLATSGFCMIWVEPVEKRRFKD